jgi:peptidyl-prolyl cis-trans isomerase B (cyclophilin B)
MREQQFDRRWIILAVFAVVAAAIVVVILISRGGGGTGGSDTTAKANATDNGCKKVEAPEPSKKTLPPPSSTHTMAAKGEKVKAVVETSCGTFDIELDTTRAPKTANSFAYLVVEGFYDGLTFHRIVPGFVIQGGDPLGTGSGSAGYKVVEKPPANLSYTKGVVAMAKTSSEPPGTSGSQFFVVTGADAGLPPEYALVGKVSSGMDVVERIGKLGTPQETPKQTVLIEHVELEPG